MRHFKSAILSTCVISLAACASTPMGPTVMVNPTPGKPFEQFAAEQSMCKGYADDQVKGQAESANSTGLLEGVGGTVLGAGLGAALGGGRGAAIGAAGGAVAGTAVGANTSGHQQLSIQQQYNNAFAQCMTAKGNVVQQPAPRPARTIVYAAPPPTVVYAAPPPPTVIYQQAPTYQPAPPPPAPAYPAGQQVIMPPEPAPATAAAPYPY